MTEQEFYIQLGLKIKRIRSGSLITQKRMAEVLKVSQSYLCEIEKGKKPISCYLLRRIKDAIKEETK